MAASSVSITGLKPLQRRVSLVERRLSEVAISGHLGTTVKPYLSRQARKRFQVQGDEASGPWATLTTATNSWRASLGFNPIKPINVRTGHLREMITNSKPDVTTTPQMSVLSFPGNNILDRPDMFHRVQQAVGNRRGPARPVVAMDGTDIAWVLASMQKFVVSGVEIGAKR